ncbi:hypothetical protein ACOMHN_011165 [Nucella lapillus]
MRFFAAVPILGSAALPPLMHRALYLLIMVTSVCSRSLTSRLDVTTTTTSARTTPSSHLLFYLAVEKELVPQTADLAQRALQLLELQCSQLQRKTSQCMTEAQQLPAIPALGDFPSRRTLKREGTKLFTKYLLKEAYTSVHKLQRLLEEEDEGFEPLTDLVTHMVTTRLHLKTQIESLYQVRLREKKYVGLKNTKLRYTRRPRTKGGNCPENPQDCLTQVNFRLRLVYTLYTRLLRINHVLDYTCCPTRVWNTVTVARIWDVDLVTAGKILIEGPDEQLNGHVRVNS